MQRNKFGVLFSVFQFFKNLLLLFLIKTIFLIAVDTNLDIFFEEKMIQNFN